MLGGGGEVDKVTSHKFYFLASFSDPEDVDSSYIPPPPVSVNFYQTTRRNIPPNRTLHYINTWNHLII
jgi:hypothetical protein